MPRTCHQRKPLARATGETLLSNKRFGAKRDISEPAIVEALEKAGYLVYKDLPVDLLIRRPADPIGCLYALEVKTPSPSGKLPVRRDRAAQQRFMAETGTQAVGTPEAALRAMDTDRTYDQDVIDDVPRYLPQN